MKVFCLLLGTPNTKCLLLKTILVFSIRGKGFFNDHQNSAHQKNSRIGISILSPGNPHFPRTSPPRFARTSATGCCSQPPDAPRRRQPPRPSKKRRRSKGLSQGQMDGIHVVKIVINHIINPLIVINPINPSIN